MICKHCGKEIGMGYNDDTLEAMASREACFKCNFWLEHYEKDTKTGVGIVVDGTHYVDGGNSNKSDRGMLGFGGSTYHIRFNDGRELKTNNLWCQGDIPDIFRDKFPDNAVFV